MASHKEYSFWSIAKRFCAGFLCGGIPGFLISVAQGFPPLDAFRTLIGMGTIFGGMAALFGKRMLDFIVGLLKGGFG